MAESAPRPIHCRHRLVADAPAVGSEKHAEAATSAREECSAANCKAANAERGAGAAAVTGATEGEDARGDAGLATALAVAGCIDEAGAAAAAVGDGELKLLAATGAAGAAELLPLLWLGLFGADGPTLPPPPLPPLIIANVTSSPILDVQSNLIASNSERLTGPTPPAEGGCSAARSNASSNLNAVAT